VEFFLADRNAAFVERLGKKKKRGSGRFRSELNGGRYRAACCFVSMKSRMVSSCTPSIKKKDAGKTPQAELETGAEAQEENERKIT